MQTALEHTQRSLLHQSVPLKVAEATLDGFRAQREKRHRTVPRSQRAAAGRREQARAAVSENNGGDDRAVPRQGADAAADGPLSRGARSRNSPAGVGTRRQTPPAG